MRTARTGSSSSLVLVQTRIYLHVSVDEVLEFEEAISKTEGWSVVSGPRPLEPLKLIARLVACAAVSIDTLLYRFRFRFGSKHHLCVGYLAPHYAIYKTFPYFSIPGGLRMIWLYDAWENHFDEIEAFLRRTRIDLAFFSGQQATDHFRKRSIPRLEAHWIPEGITVATYRSKPYNERPTDVIQIGRKWDEYHTSIAPYCLEKGIVYVFQDSSGKIIYPTREGFLAGLADAKISICVPSSITHPKRSGGVSTMTWRYLQSMASKCLVLGRVPEDMKGLFKHNPVVEIEMHRPGEQLMEILDNFTEYQGLIELNYRCVTDSHQWTNRLAEMQRIIASRLQRSKTG